MTAPPPPLAPNECFVLVDQHGAQPNAPQRAALRLYRNPSQQVVAHHPAEVAGALASLRALHAAGAHLAGYMAYEAGLALEPRLHGLADGRCGANGPLLWFGAFDGWQPLDHAAAPAWLTAQAAPGPHRLGPLLPSLGPGAYAQGFAQLAHAIHAGDIYQANFTFPLEGRWAGCPLALHAQLMAQGGAMGALVYDGAQWLLSHAPELFVALAAGAVRARPMKGTRPRGATPDADAALRADLANSPKDRAENLMILDLMRNDIAQVSVPGSVRATAPFAIESYASVHQMVSGVQATLRPGLGPLDLLAALFPCGSVTGAPKIRAMELIAQTEAAPRGPYCGAIGTIDPAPAPLPTAPLVDQAANLAQTPLATGDACFNVAIRTLVLTGDGAHRPATAGRAVLGVGSAVVADSTAMGEWRECLVKGSFVHQPAPGKTSAQFDLIETMAFAPDTGIAHLELHLARMKASADALGFAYDRHAARNTIHALCFEAEAPARLRLSLARCGAMSLELAPMPPALPAPAPCVLLPLPLDAGDWRLAHKTSDRWFYDAGLRAARAVGAAEALFVREDGLLTEGCFTSLFIERDGVLLTPPARLGLLPGVLARHLLDTGRAREAELRPDDLLSGFMLGNALRGLMPARLCPPA